MEALETAAPPDESVLDNPVWTALTGPQAEAGVRNGGAVRFAPDIAPFAAVADEFDPACWADLAELLRGRGGVVLLDDPGSVPAGWEVVQAMPGVQMLGAGMRAEAAPEAVRLGPADVPDILALVAATQPGPYLERTITLGTYLGIRRGGELIALAGERMHPPGWTEISAVCTAPSARGQGLATTLMRAVAVGIRARGDEVILHAAASNTGAIRLYEQLGFTVRRRPIFTFLRPTD